MDVEIAKKLFAPGSIAVYGKRGSCWRVVKFNAGSKTQEPELFVESMNESRKQKFDKPISNFRPYLVQLGMKIYNTSTKQVVGKVVGFKWSGSSVIVVPQSTVTNVTIPQTPAEDLLGISGEFTLNPNI